MPVLVGIFTAQMLQDGRLMDIAVKRNQSTPTGAAEADRYRNALAMPFKLIFSNRAGLNGAFSTSASQAHGKQAMRLDR